jgi:hypothetical protein
MAWTIQEPFGPVYNIEAAPLQKSRAQVRVAGSLAALPIEDRHAYGEAVEKAILAKQRSELMSAAYAEAAPRPRCASGAIHNDGAKISAALRAQQRAKLQACKSRIAGLKDWELKREYEAAISAKRAAADRLDIAA